MPLTSSFHRMLSLFMLVSLAYCAPDEAADCDLRIVAQMPLELQDQLLIVPGFVNGTSVKLIVDTGAERTTIANASAERLGLPHDSRHTTRSHGVGGTTTTTDVKVDRLMLGGVHFPVERVAVGTFTLQSDRGLNADGLLGADVLLAFDMDIDVPGGKLTLYHARRCKSAQLPWQQPAVEIIGVQTRRDRLLLPFAVDGVNGMAMLDTGAQHNVIGVAMARRLGLDTRAMAGDPTIRQHGVGPAEMTAHLHQFNVMRIGPVSQQPATLTVMESDAGIGDGLIGDAFLSSRRVWLSYHNRQIYVSEPAQDD